jgi:hypothetical protein
MFSKGAWAPGKLARSLAAAIVGTGQGIKVGFFQIVKLT